MKILILEDDDMIGSSLQRSLKKSGYTCDWIQKGKDLFPAVQHGQYTLIIMDLGLPDADGFDLLEKLRQQKVETHVLVLTARDTIDDRVKGLDLGADDYMLKPFAFEELEARLRLLHRRSMGIQTSVIELGELKVNISSHQVFFQNNPVTLSAKEFKLLMCFVQQPELVYTLSQLEDKLYGWNEEVSSNSVEVHIHQLRKKIQKNIIKNIRNVGYCLGKLDS